MSRSRVHGAVVVMVLVTLGGSASAGEAEDLIAQGIKLRKQNRDQEALPLFQKALDLKVTPRALGQVGTCEQALGLWVAGERHITEALKFPADPWVQESRDALTSAHHFVQARLGWIEVWGSPVGATVRIDGDRVATLPMASPVRVPIGQRGLTVEATGYFPENRTVEVRPGDSVREHVALRASSIAARAQVPTLGPTGDPPEGPPTITPPPRAGSIEQRTWKTPLGLGLGVAGVGLLAWGVVWIAIDGNTYGMSCATCRPQVRNTKTIGWILAGTGAASMLGGGLLLYSDGGGTKVVLGAARSGLLLAGVF
jgi:hypothetical protein